MEVAELDEALKVLDSSLSLIEWRLKSQSRRRLEIDILALCTGMRPVVMIDYGGKMPELQERLCALIKLIQKRGFVKAHADDGLLEIFGLKQGRHASFVMFELISTKHIAQPCVNSKFVFDVCGN